MSTLLHMFCPRRETCIWLRTRHSEYAMMSPFSFFSSLWLLTVACFLIAPCRVVSLEADPPSWWPADEHSAWDQLKRAQRFFLLPAVRKQVVGNQAFEQPAKPEPQVRMIGRAASLVDRNLHPGFPTKGKRGVGEVTGTETLATDRPALDPEITVRLKRCRLEKDDEVHRALQTWLQLSERPWTIGGGSVRGPQLKTNDDLLDPWDLSELRMQRAPPPTG